MSNSLNLNKYEPEKLGIIGAYKEFSFLFDGEWKNLIFVFMSVLLNSGSTIITPFLIAYSIDKYISTNKLNDLNLLLLGLVFLYIINAISSFYQTRLVGIISQRVLLKLRSGLFNKIQYFPITFFSDNLAGDIITRINGDTEKINNFLSRSVFQFISSFFTFIGIGIFIFFLNWKMALLIWSTVILILLVNKVLSPLVQKSNNQSLKSNSEMISFLDENVNNFKALVVFNKGEYLKDSFLKLNQDNFRKTTISQTLNAIFNPIYNLFGNIAQILTLIFGIYLLLNRELTTGLLVGFIAYSQKFYEPVRSLGNVWGTFQEAISAWNRIKVIFKIK